MASAGMIAKLKETFCQPRIRFLYDGTDYSSSVISISDISRNWNLSPCTVTIQLNNRLGTWDLFLTDPAALTKKVQIQFYLNDFDEVIDLYTGYVESASYNHKRKVMTITARDRISRLLENQIISIYLDQITPVTWNYFEFDGITRVNAHVVSDTVWHILTDYGDLHSVASSSNTDIDYTSWLTWAEYVDDGGYTLYDIGVICHGESVNSILLKILQLTESIAWVAGDGKINFKASTQTEAGQTYTKAHLIGEPSYSVSLDGRCNAIYAKWGYNLAGDFWQSGSSSMTSHSHIVGPTEQQYIYQTEYEDDRSVFHNSTTSAQKYIDEKFLRTVPPIRTWSVQTNLLGFVEDVGNEIILSGLYVVSPYDSIEVHLTSVSFDVMNFIPTLSGYYIWGAGEL